MKTKFLTGVVAALLVLQQEGATALFTRDYRYDRIIKIEKTGPFRSFSRESLNMYNEEIKKEHTMAKEVVQGNFKSCVKGAIITTVIVPKYINLPDNLQDIDLETIQARNISTISLFFFNWKFDSDKENKIHIKFIPDVGLFPQSTPILESLIQKIRFDEIPRALVVAMFHMWCPIKQYLMNEKVFPEFSEATLDSVYEEFVINSVERAQKIKNPEANNFCEEETIRNNIKQVKSAPKKKDNEKKKAQLLTIIQKMIK
jgi:hypothetical protein